MYAFLLGRDYYALGNLLTFMKGREKMNMFQEVNSIFGNDQTEHQKQAFDEFITAAKEIRTRLGKQAYLLDKYLSYLFEAANQKLAYDAASEGFDVAGELIGICAGIIRNEPRHTDHAFYEQAKEYIDSHPLLFQEPHTLVSMYCSLLNRDFMKFAAKQFYSKVEDESIAVLDICDLHELYAKICDLLGGEEAMEKLNLLYRQRFLIADAMTIFFQSMTNQLLYSLTYRDRETSKQVFQLLLDGGEQE